MTKCRKCGKPKWTLKLEIDMCDCPINKESENLLREILALNEKKKQKKD